MVRQVIRKISETKICNKEAIYHSVACGDYASNNSKRENVFAISAINQNVLLMCNLYVQISQLDKDRHFTREVSGERNTNSRQCKKSISSCSPVNVDQLAFDNTPEPLAIAKPKAIKNWLRKVTTI